MKAINCDKNKSRQNACLSYQIFNSLKSFQENNQLSLVLLLASSC